MNPPGATTSGLRLSSASGPQELKLEIVPAVGSAIETRFDVHVTERGDASARIALPSACEIETAGTPTDAPAPEKRPGTLLANTMAVAPAATARRSLSSKRQ